MAATIDLNADAGESFGRWRLGRDEELLELVSSVNLACGFHAGDPLTMLASLRLAARLKVAVGAHPGLRDLEGFGRRAMMVTAEEAYALTLYQIGALTALAGAAGIELSHVKPHGALYLQMNREESTCRAVAEAARDANLPLVVLAGSRMEEWAAAAGAETVAEAFPERAYLADGSLAPRHLPGSAIFDPIEAAERASAMARGEPFPALDGGELRVRPRTLCIHGDNPAAVDIARAVRSRLQRDRIRIEAF